MILQQVREAERNNIFQAFKDKEKSVINGVVQQIENNNIIVDLDRATGIIFKNEQIPDENYRIGQRVKVYLKEVEMSSRGPIIRLSRTHPKLIEHLFTKEVPEIESGTVKIKNIAREAGVRTKMSVISSEESIDPVGACVGQRGTRVQAVLSEIGSEKIDIIPYSDNPETYIRNALSPAKVTEIKIDDKKKLATVKVDDDQLSLAIGKHGQNVRLASNLTGFEIDIVGLKEGEEGETEKQKPADKKSARTEKKLIR